MFTSRTLAAFTRLIHLQLNSDKNIYNFAQMTVQPKLQSRCFTVSEVVTQTGSVPEHQQREDVCQN